jgi:hypothetical protein
MPGPSSIFRFRLAATFPQPGLGQWSRGPARSITRRCAQLTPSSVTAGPVTAGRLTAGRLTAIMRLATHERIIPAGTR